MGNDCGSVVRAVTPDLQFISSHQQILFPIHSIKKSKKRKEAGNGRLLNLLDVAVNYCISLWLQRSNCFIVILEASSVCK